MARRQGINPYDKPTYGKAWNDLSQRTQREWLRKFAEADAAGRTQAPNVVRYYFEQKNNYWIPRAEKLAGRIPDNIFGKYQLTDEEARIYVLAGGPQKKPRTAAQKKYLGELWKILHKKQMGRTGKKFYYKHDLNAEIYS